MFVRFRGRGSMESAVEAREEGGGAVSRRRSRRRWVASGAQRREPMARAWLVGSRVVWGVGGGIACGGRGGGVGGCVAWLVESSVGCAVKVAGEVCPVRTRRDQ